MMSKPVVSVIVPCYNQAAFLPKCIDSILAQTFESWECIIVNDGSSDNTREVAIEYASRDIRIIYLEQKNQGLSGARNAGLNHISGQYVQFLDADDWLDKEKFKIQVTELNKIHGMSVSYTDYINHDSAGSGADRYLPIPELINSAFAPYILARDWETRCSIPAHCFLFDARFFNELSIRFDQNLESHEDWDCWMSILSLNPYIILVPMAMAVYHRHGNSMCSDHKRMWRGYSKAIRKQKRVWKDDPIMLGILSGKMSEIRAIYKQPEWLYDTVDSRFLLPLGRILHRGKKIYREKTPWPIQKWIEKLTL